MEKELKDTLIGVLDKKMNRQLMYYLDVCARCAICKDACHQYKATEDVRFLPAYRAELLRRIYKSREIDEKLLDELKDVTYACTGCRRCMLYCPFSIDTTWILSAAKAVLLAAGKGSEILTQLADAAVEKGKSIDLFRDIIIDMLKDTERELKERVGDPEATIPIDKQGARVLYVALAGTHSILPAAVIFHQAKESWTLSLFESSNYGYFLGDAEKARQIADRFVEEAQRLGVEKVVITECGHAYRLMKFFYEAWAKEKLPFKVESILETIDGYLREGKILIDQARINEPVTYHDPCQIARNGGIFEQPRAVVNQVATDFREMTPNREKNWCCGGGGGLVAEPALEEFRIKTGELKAKQIRETGAKIVVSPCENCRLQIETLNEKYNLGVKISSIMDLVADAIVVKERAPVL